MNSQSTSSQRTRRQFFGDLARGGLVLGVVFGSPLRVLALSESEKDEVPTDFKPNAFIRIGTDGKVTIIAKHDEMGQGIHTGLAIAICEELEIDVSEVTVVPAPAGSAYGNSAYFVQVTGGSTSTWSSFKQMREAGATAREMLIAAAAQKWSCDAKECIAENGSVRKKDGSASAGYGDLATLAASVPVPKSVKLKSRSEFTRIGKPTPRVDSADKVRGTALFSLDQRAPGMLTAMVARSPYFGGTLKSVDDTAARAVAGVKGVVKIPQGVAVIADGFWNASRGRDALKLEWEPGPAGALDSDRLYNDYVALSRTKGLVARNDGDAEAVLESAKTSDTAKRLDVVYQVPFQAHAPMEPLSCMVELRPDGGALVTTGSQMLGADLPAVAARLGVPASKIEFKNSYLGGGFGRRANPKSDFVIEALEVALAAKSLGVPIKTVWDRQDDLHGGWYRPMFVNAISGVVDSGKITAWRHRVVGQSISQGTPFEGMLVKDGVDHMSVEGASDMPHGIENLQVELHTVSLPVPVLWWRSVGHSNTAYAKESFIDECAVAMKRDPYELRRELLKGHKRLLRVLDLAAEKANWKEKPAPGVGRGISVHESFKGFAAHVVEASVDEGFPKIHRIVCAIDCGQVVNPDQVETQMQGAAIFALSATLGSQITFKEGKVEQTNFHDFEIVRMHESPKVEVHIVDSSDPMGGIGEVGVPGIPSATCHALFEACGTRVRRLPVRDQLF